MRQSYLVFGSPLIGDDEIAEVLATIRSGWLGTGPKTHRFERRFAEYVGSAHCVATSSCTASLHLAMLAAGIGAGDEVIVPAMTFAATANAVLHAGATPVFADVGEDDMNLDLEQVRRRITRRTRAVVPVHFHGRPVDCAGLRALADEHGLLVIADAAHAIEARWDGRPVAAWADLTCYSFYITKNVTTVEGGMVATERRDWADGIKVRGLHGLSADAWSRYSDEGFKHYQVVALGFKYNMTDLQASFGLHQLARVEENLARREEIWDAYDRGLAGLPLRLPPAPAPGTRHARHLYSVRTTAGSPLGRDRLMAELHRRNIGSGVHYTALHLHPFYAERLGHRTGDFPASEAIGASTLSLPLSAALTDADVEDVIAALGEVLA
jgi:dTDP-4-amino-4,6-dideoxygalactose transaminase